MTACRAIAIVPDHPTRLETGSELGGIEMVRRLAGAMQFWVGLVLVVIGALWIYGSQQIFVPRVMSDSIGPRTFPLLIGTVLVILGPLVWLRAALEGTDRLDLGKQSLLAVLLGASVVYLLLFERLGYVLSTALYTIALFYYLGERRHWLTWIVSVGVTLLFYFGFADFLNVNLPKGPLGL